MSKLLILIFLSLNSLANSLSSVADEMDRKCSGLKSKNRECYKKFEDEFETSLVRDLKSLESDPAFSSEELAKLRKKIMKRVKSKI